MKSVYSMYSSGIEFDKTSSASVAVRTLATWSWRLETRSKKSHYDSIHSTSHCSAKCWWKSNQIKASRLQPCCDSESRPKESALYFLWCPGAFLAQVEKTALVVFWRGKHGDPGIPGPPQTRSHGFSQHSRPIASPQGLLIARLQQYHGMCGSIGLSRLRKTMVWKILNLWNRGSRQDEPWHVGVR